MGAAPADLTAFCLAQHPRLVGILSLYVGDAAVAEELAQETLLRVATRWGRVSGLDEPGGWAYRVAINLANSHFRRRGAARRAEARMGPAPADEHRDPDTAARLAVRSAVAELPARQREAVVLRHFLDLTVAETARHMGASPDAVTSLTKRAVATLRDLLDPSLDLEEVDADA